jgi:hypothetical protein
MIPLRRITGKWPRLVVAGLLLAGVLLLHAPLLRGLVAPLIVNQPTEQFDAICFSAWGETPDGDRCYDVVKELCAKNPDSVVFPNRRVLIVAPSPSRLEEIGVTPSFESLSRRELSARGISDESLTILHGKHGGDSATARAIAGWLGQHPDATVTLLCDQFRSAYVRRALDAVLDPAMAARVHIHPLASRRCDQTNWWKSRAGFRAFGTGWLVYLHGLWYGGKTAEVATKNADGYERDFLEHLRERTP